MAVLINNDIRPVPIAEEDEAVHANYFIALDTDTVQEIRYRCDGSESTEEPAIAEGTLFNVAT